MDCSPSGSSVHRILQQEYWCVCLEYWNGLPFPSPGYLPNPVTEPAAPALASRFFTTELPGRLSVNQTNRYILYSVVNGKITIWRRFVGSPCSPTPGRMKEVGQKLPWEGDTNSPSLEEQEKRREGRVQSRFDFLWSTSSIIILL